MSGWINLDAKQAERLLADWGFVVAEEKATTKLWTHPHDPEKRLIPFSIPSRGSKANGKGSFRTAAQVVGVSVARFQQGVDKGALDRLQTAFIAHEADALDAHKAQPDPLGIGSALRSQKAAEALTTAFFPPTESVKEPLTVERVEASGLRGRDGKSFGQSSLDAVLTAMSLEPVTLLEVIDLTGLSKNTVERVALYLVDEGKVARRYATRDEIPFTGRAPFLYYAGADVPTRRSIPHQTTVEEQIADSTPTTPQEQPVPDAKVIDLNQPKPATDAARIYEDTGMPWPDGGVVLRDIDGRLWVAQPLVVGK